MKRKDRERAKETEREHESVKKRLPPTIRLLSALMYLLQFISAAVRSECNSTWQSPCFLWPHQYPRFIITHLLTLLLEEKHGLLRWIECSLVGTYQRFGRNYCLHLHRWSSHNKLWSVIETQDSQIEIAGMIIWRPGGTEIVHHGASSQTSASVMKHLRIISGSA